MISRTVSIPAKTDFSLFQRGAETTPGDICEMDLLILKRHTIEQKTLQGLFDTQLRV